jgi:dephospho-CoA kinase
MYFDLNGYFEIDVEESDGLNVGLTGGIACGKSTVSRMFEERGAAIVDADAIAREVVLPGQSALREVAEAFGGGVITPEGTLDRKRLGSIVFGDETARKKLEAILHPRIRAELSRQMEHWSALNPGGITIVDIPLLFESGLDRLYAFDDVLVVYVPRAVQLDRLITRDALTEEEANRRIEAQMPIEEKRLLADVVINNSGTLADTAQQVESYLAGKTGAS